MGGKDRKVGGMREGKVACKMEGKRNEAWDEVIPGRKEKDKALGET